MQDSVLYSQNPTRKSFLSPFLKMHTGEFPGAPVVRIQCFHCHGPSLIPGWGTKILHSMGCSPPQKRRWKHWGSLVTCHRPPEAAKDWMENCQSVFSESAATSYQPTKALKRTVLVWRWQQEGPAVVLGVSGILSGRSNGRHPPRCESLAVALATRRKKAEYWLV